jgi:hypothetical protein
MVLCYGESKLVFAGPMSLEVTCESYTFLRAFAKLQKATISFVMSVRPPAWNNSAPTRLIFMKFDI